MTEHFSDVTAEEKHRVGQAALGQLVRSSVSLQGKPEGEGLHSQKPITSKTETEAPDEFVGSTCWESQEIPTNWFEKEYWPPAGQTMCN